MRPGLGSTIGSRDPSLGRHPHGEVLNGGADSPTALCLLLARSCFADCAKRRRRRVPAVGVLVPRHGDAVRIPHGATTATFIAKDFLTTPIYGSRRPGGVARQARSLRPGATGLVDAVRLQRPAHRLWRTRAGVSRDAHGERRSTASAPGHALAARADDDRPRRRSSSPTRSTASSAVTACSCCASEVLRRIGGYEDVLARLGGDEFAMRESVALRGHLDVSQRIGEGMRRCPGSSRCLASSTQQMNSLRARGVMCRHASRARPRAGRTAAP